MWNLAKYADGSHTIRLTAADVVGNSANTSINVTVDNTTPVIQLHSANETEFYSDQYLTIDYNATDATSGVRSSSAVLDGAAITKGDIIDLRTCR